MAPHTWANAEQALWLTAQFPLCLTAHANSKIKSLTRFWNRMAEEFFEKWPQELALDLPSGPGVVLTPEQLNALGKATALTKLVSIVTSSWQSKQADSHYMNSV